MSEEQFFEKYENVGVECQHVDSFLFSWGSETYKVVLSVSIQRLGHLFLPFIAVEFEWPVERGYQGMNSAQK